MCGLVGYAGRAPVVSAERLAAMRDRLTHRGPDDAGVWLGADGVAAVGLAHRRLSILDTRTVGRQPMASPGGRVQIVFNGEIYNFQDLRDALQAKGHTFQTRTDTEVLLHLYQAHGPALVDHLNGMFAFALWDADERRLLVARDRLGIKPLFYGTTPDGGVLFGSEIKALLAAEVLDDGIDLQAMHDYLGLTYSPGPRTVLRGVKKLPPAHTLTWTPQGGVQLRRYWQQRFHSQGPARRPPRFEEAAEQTLAELQAAVRRRLVADVPLGMFLSGGVDSSAILWAMAQATSAPVKAFTIGFDEAGYDERSFAAVAAKAFGAEHHVEVVRPDPDTFMGPLTEAMDEPYADSSAIPLWYLARLARRHVTVSLGGDGGDELYAGYRTHFAWRLGAWYRALPRGLRARVPDLVRRLPVSHGKVSFDLKARQFVHAADHAAPVAHYRFKEFLAEPARRALHGAQVADSARLFEAAFEAGSFRHELDGVLATDFALYLPDDILVKVDRMSMAHSLEARVPFLDHTLVEHAASLPAHYKLRGLNTKAVLRRALAPHLPQSLLARRKAGFNVPMAAWLSGPLNPLLRDMLSVDRVQRIGLWRASEVQRLIHEHEQKRADHSRPLWALLCFALFNQRWRGGRPA